MPTPSTTSIHRALGKKHAERLRKDNQLDAHLSDELVFAITAAPPHQDWRHSAPYGWREIGLDGLGDHEGWVTYGLGGMHTEYRQLAEPWFPRATGCHMVWYYDATGVGFTAEGPGKRPRIYVWGCHHEWVHHSNDGKCLNTYKCKHCDRLNQVDSSD